ncbi:MAG: hypothetical protein SWX82_16230 [Cyanobacteriota bacterium]|nr:hypothetical protein [Cyanobacteriota bacterium]
MLLKVFFRSRGPTPNPDRGGEKGSGGVGEQRVVRRNEELTSYQLFVIVMLRKQHLAGALKIRGFKSPTRA